MRILVTNDDGIDSEGLRVLVQRLADVGSVTVAAPASEFSGAGAAIGHLDGRLPDALERTVPGASAAFAVEGPPAICSIMALGGAFGDAPDLIVSGINPGWNVGRALLHSGTIGAVLTGAEGGVPGIAVSQHTARGAGAVQQWETAATIAALAAARLGNDNYVSPPPVLNINLANIGQDELMGVSEAIPSDRVPYSVGSVSLGEPDTTGRRKASFSTTSYANDPDRDTAVVDAKHVALTWLRGPHGTSVPAPVDATADAVRAEMVDYLRSALGLAAA